MTVPELDSMVAERLEQLGRPLLVAVHGRSGTGKSTLASELAKRHGGRSITADDFWPGGDDQYWLALAPVERAERVIDWRRLRTDVLEPLLAGRSASWRIFDWETGQGLSEHQLSCEPAPVIVLDGAYSSRPELADVVDVSVLLTLDDQIRRSRLAAREGAGFTRHWHSLWDETEDYYFTTVRPPDSFDIVLAME